MKENDRLAVFGGPKARPGVPTRQPIAPGASFIGLEEINAVTRVLQNRILYRHWGIEVQEFEKAFAKRMGVPFAVAVNSGTTALLLALRALRVGPGDEVVIPAYSFIGVASAIVFAGATPVFCDVDASLTISIAALERLVRSQTRVVIGAHMKGSPCDIASLKTFCHKHSLELIEDVSQACGATFRGQPLGSFGRVGFFSLQHFKVITTGEGGVLTTSDDALFRQLVLLHDAAAPWVHPEWFLESQDTCSLNYRMSEIEGALGTTQLERLTNIILDMRVRRRSILQHLDDVSGFSLRLEHDSEGDIGTSLILILRDDLTPQSVFDALTMEGVPVGLLLQANREPLDRHFCEGWGRIIGSKYLRREYDCDQSRSFLSRTIEIPIDPHYSSDDLEQIALGIRKVLKYYC